MTLVEFNGQHLSIAEWGRRMNIPPTTIAYRLSSAWDVEHALTMPAIPPKLRRHGAVLRIKRGQA